MGKSRQKHRRAAADRAAAAVENERGHVHGHWPALTGLRGLAAVGVLLFNMYLLAGRPADLPAPFAWLCAVGWSGADVFFTLSAFLLTLPFVEAQELGAPEPSLRDYWRHRGWRILPAYWLQVLILFAFAIAGAQVSYWQQPEAASLAVNALFLYHLVPLSEPALPAWWTLPVELGFYLVLPWLTRLLRPSRWPWMLLAIAASLAWRWWVLHAGFSRAQELAWADHLPGRLHQFVVGMLAAWALLRWRSRLATISPLQRDLLCAAAVSVFLALPMLALPYTGTAYDGAAMAPWPLLGFHLYASLLIALLLLMLASGPSHAARLFGAGWLQALGLVSFSLYLWQVPVLLALRGALGGPAAVNAAFAPFAFQGLLFSLLAAAASWWLVEQPAQRRARRDKMPAQSARA